MEFHFIVKIPSSFYQTLRRICKVEDIKIKKFFDDNTTYVLLSKLPISLAEITKYEVFVLKKISFDEVKQKEILTLCN